MFLPRDGIALKSGGSIRGRAHGALPPSTSTLLRAGGSEPRIDFRKSRKYRKFPGGRLAGRHPASETANSGQMLRASESRCPRRGLRRWGPPATGGAEIAQIAQISKASMKWASACRRDVPLQIAQIAENTLGTATARGPGRKGKNANKSENL